MKAVNVSSLKNNPSEALRYAREDRVSLVRSARLAKMPLVDFIAHASRLGIPIINQTAQEVEQDIDTLDQWLASSKPS